ncbi:MAG: hypothetical protein WCF91_00140 [bacterium]
MTRFLNSSLELDHHDWHHLLRSLESANNHPTNDIRLTNEINNAGRYKLKQLGLDPDDTTASELYHVLQSKLHQDDKILTRNLTTLAMTHSSLSANVSEGLIYALKNSPDSKRCYAMKMPVMKTIIKQLPPKKTMKKLGYRSMASMIKHESAINLITASWLIEDDNWRKKLVDSYKKLKPSDFENRNIIIQSVNYKRWQSLESDVVEIKKHNVLAFKELGALIVLPLPKSAPKGSVTASLVVALEELNKIRALSSFLKLSQVKAHYGQIVREAVINEPSLHSDISKSKLPWSIVQRYYANFEQHFNQAVFEPHLSIDDLVWHPIEESLFAIESNMDFWRNTSSLASSHIKQSVSFNIHDVALNTCNNRSIQNQITKYFKKSLWQEFLLRYFSHNQLEDVVSHELQPQLAEVREN